MILAKMITNIWSTKKTESLSGYKFMLVEELQGTTKGRRFIVVDTIGAGIGENVIVATGSAARRMLGNDDLPVDAAVVGIIDEDCNFG